MHKGAEQLIKFDIGFLSGWGLTPMLRLERRINKKLRKHRSISPEVLVRLYCTEVIRGNIGTDSSPAAYLQDRDPMRAIGPFGLETLFFLKHSIPRNGFNPKTIERAVLYFKTNGRLMAPKVIKN